MNRAQRLLQLAQTTEVINLEDPTNVDESLFTIKRIRAVRGGKIVMLKKRKYAGIQGRDGFKRDVKTGRLVRMTALERRRRSKAMKKVNRKATTKRNREISLRRREQSIENGGAKNK